MRISNTVSFVKARRAEQAVALNTGDVTSLQQQIASMVSQYTTLSNGVSAMQQQIVSLQQQINTLSQAYEAHTHGYSDTDSTGAVINKTTSVP